MKPVKWRHFILFMLKDGQTEVISLNKPSKGAEDKKYTNGLRRVNT
jgi:hypothetical protein